MRARFLPFIIFCALAVVSCKKDEANSNVILKNSTNSANSTITYSAEGKWAVTKIEAYTLGIAGNVSNEIVYKKPLADSNYAEFTKEGNCLWNTDHYYTGGENGKGVIPQSNFRLSSFQYSVYGLSIDLATTRGPIGPNATPESENATFTGPNTLVIHSTYAIDANTWVVSDSYFTRQ